jgi:ATP-dependent Clp protease ATP-binding subunit ClpA
LRRQHRDPQGPEVRFEEHHKVEYTGDALKAAVELSVKHINDRLLPDKAIDVIDEAGARQRLLPEASAMDQVDVPEIEYIVARIARIPPKQVSASDRDVLRNLERNLKMVVFGQDSAIEILAARSRWRARDSAISASRSAPSCSPARPASARPKSRASSRCNWASS